eukprot:5617662-Pyramimonas_sp.AAC.1
MVPDLRQELVQCRRSHVGMTTVFCQPQLLARRIKHDSNTNGYGLDDLGDRSHSAQGRPSPNRQGCLDRGPAFNIKQGVAPRGVPRVPYEPRLLVRLMHMACLVASAFRTDCEDVSSNSLVPASLKALHLKL